MLRHYLLVAFRHLRRRKGYAALNVAGLAVGLACVVLLLLYARDERSYDRFHEHADRIVRVVRERQVSEGEWSRLAITPWRLAEMLEASLAPVQRAVRFTAFPALVSRSDAEPGQQEERFFYADSTVFDVFTFPLVAGDPATALTEPFSVVLTETTARRYFGDADPVGQTLRVDEVYDFTVTGVARDVPAASHLHFDFLASLSSLATRYAGVTEMFESWGAVWLYTYLLLDEGTDVAALEAQVAQLVQEHMGGATAGGTFRLPFQLLTDIHLHSDYDSEIGPNGSAAALTVLLLIAGFILLLACVNFMNLATARAAARMKEVGVRKAVGAHRLDLVGQFLGEAVLMSFLALGLALVLAAAALPAFNAFTGKALTLGAWPLGVLGFAALALLVGVVAGSYPALYLSGFRPAAILRGGLALSGRGAARLRQGLVVLQFAVTIALIAATAVVYQQLRYVQARDLGFDRAHVVRVELEGERARKHVEALKAAFARSPAVASVSAASNAPPDGLNTWTMGWEGRPEGIESSIRIVSVDYDYLDALGLDLAAGRALSEAMPTDATSAFLINEAGARDFGFAEPVGQRVRFTVGDQLVREGEVVGVVKDYHLASLHEAIRPVVLTVRSDWYNLLLVRVRPGATREALAHLEAEWAAMHPDRPFTYSFLDERLDALYRADVQLGQLVRAFALLAVLIACLGLFGLAAYTAERRTKEIGVRKVLGAGVSSLVALLSKDFLRLVLVGFVVATPLAYVAVERWLEGFAYRIDVGIGAFLFAGGLALVIALLTVGAQALRAATANPVKALRYE